MVKSWVSQHLSQFFWWVNMSISISAGKTMGPFLVNLFLTVKMVLSENSVPHCTQWFCWSLSLLGGYFIGTIPHFQTYPNSETVGKTNHFSGHLGHVASGGTQVWKKIQSDLAWRKQVGAPGSRWEPLGAPGSPWEPGCCWVNCLWIYGIKYHVIVVNNG